MKGGGGGWGGEGRGELIIECTNCTYTPRELTYLGESILLPGIDKAALKVC